MVGRSALSWKYSPLTIKLLNINFSGLESENDYVSSYSNWNGDALNNTERMCQPFAMILLMPKKYEFQSKLGVRPLAAKRPDWIWRPAPDSCKFCAIFSSSLAEDLSALTGDSISIQEGLEYSLAAAL